MDPCSQEDLQILSQHQHEEYIIRLDVWIQTEILQIKFRNVLEFATAHKPLFDEQVLQRCIAILGERAMVQGDQPSPEACQPLARKAEKGAIAKERK